MRRTGLVLSSVLSSLALGSTAYAGGAALFESDTQLPNGCGPNGCWSNYVRVTDLDGDHQLDIVVVNMQGLFSVGAGEPLVIYRNEPAGTFENVSATAIDGHGGRHRQVAIGDIDGDGDPDIYAPNANGDADTLFTNDGDMVFSQTEVDIGSQAGAARFGDLDDDGDLDLFLTDSYPDTSGPVMPAGHVFINDGTGALTELADATPAMVAGNQPIDVDLFDADGDFDLDVLIDTHQDTLALWLNDGDGTFTDASDGLVFSDFNHYNPGVCDVDGDGDLDFWVDNAASDGSEQLHINDGSGVFADETLARVSGNLPIGENGDDNGVLCVDLDYDGDFDAVVVALQSPERYLENDGDGNFTYVPGVFPGGPDSSLWAEMGDLDGDGRLDIVTVAGESADPDQFYLGADAQMVDETGPSFRAVQQIETTALDTAVVLHFAVTDNTVTDEGPRLDRAFVRVSVDGGEATEVDAHFSGGDLFRVELPAQANEGTISYTACAVDWAGNEGCADPLEYDVGANRGTTGDDPTGGADESEAGVDDTSSASGASATGASATGASATSADSGDTEDATGNSSSGEDDDGGGCSCKSGSSSVGGWALGLVVLAFARRRRTSDRRRDT